MNPEMVATITAALLTKNDVPYPQIVQAAVLVCKEIDKQTIEVQTTAFNEIRDEIRRKHEDTKIRSQDK